MGVILAVGRLGSVINDNISALLPIRGAYWVAAAMCALSTSTAWAAVWLDAAYTRQREKQRSASTSTADPTLKALVESQQTSVNSTSFLDSLAERCVAVGKALQTFDVSDRQADEVRVASSVTIRRKDSGCLVLFASRASRQSARSIMWPATCSFDAGQRKARTRHSTKSILHSRLCTSFQRSWRLQLAL